MIEKWVTDISDDDDMKPLCAAMVKKTKLLKFARFKETCANDAARAAFVKKIKDEELDEDQRDQLGELMEALSDNIQDWQTTQSEQIALKLQCAQRYDVAQKTFYGVVKQIRYQPDTQQLCSAITEAISKVDAKAEGEMLQLDFPKAPPIEYAEEPPKAIQVHALTNDFDPDPSEDAEESQKDDPE